MAGRQADTTAADGPPPHTPADGGPVTLRTVAARAGVSYQAAAAVVNGSRGGSRVSEATRLRIQQAASDLRYQPNAIARSLRRRRTDIIGFYTGHPQINANTPFQAEIITGLQAGCEAHGKDLLLHGKSRGRSAADIYGEIADGKVDGLILFTPPGDELVAHLAASHLPVVALVDAVPSLPSVVVDDEAGGRLQARHLAERGHRTVLYQTCHQDLVSAERRYRAFREEAEARGLSVRTLRAPDHRGEDPALRAVLAGPDPPTALVGWQDGSALGLLSDCLSAGLRVPGDAAVIGFDGIPTPDRPRRTSAEPVLTTVRAPWQEVARAAVGVLVARLGANEVPRETVLPVELVEGDTT